MKIICLMLSLGVLVLTITSFCGDDACQSALCKKTSDDCPSGSEHHGGLCSPFVTCATCAGFIHITSSSVIAPATIPFIRTLTIGEIAYTHTCLADIWQPPRLF